MPRLTRRSSARAGFTLAETLVVLVLLGIVVGTLLRVLGRQQRFYRSANEAIDTRSQIRQAASILPADLRSLSSVGGDILTMTGSSIKMRANIGSSIICNIPNATTFDVPPLNMARTTYTSWYSQPEPGDTAFLFDEGLSRGAEDDSWLKYAILSVTATTSTCTGAPYTDAGLDAGKDRYRISVVGALTPGVTRGAVVRFTRAAEYSLYQSGDARWYLGFRDYRNNAWTTIQAVSGPYRELRGNGNSGGGSGIGFRYFDSTGTRINDMSRSAEVARVDVRVRGRGEQAENQMNTRGGAFQDSLRVRVAIRNRH